MNKKDDKSETKLTKEELEICAQAVASLSVPVSQAPRLIELVNKLSKMVDEKQEKLKVR